MLFLLWGTALTAKDPPNVLFIVVDDLGVMDVGIETPGESFYETPRIDALARQGMRFVQGYANGPVCSPSRASLMLGTTPARHGVTDWIGAAVGEKQASGRLVKLMPPEYVAELPAKETTIAEAFREAGYDTFFAGKWHLGGKGSWPDDHGFNTNIAGWYTGGPGAGGYFAPYNEENPNLTNGPDGESLTLRLARETANYIKSQKEKPFFAMLSFYAVHTPLQTSEAHWAKYRKKAEAIGWEGNRFEIDRTLPVRLVRDNPVYAGMIETMDEAVGIALDALEAAGVADKTIICFTSDQGGLVSGGSSPTSMLPLRGGKGRQWEGGLRVPIYVYVPGMTEAGSVSQVPFTGADFFPTLLDLAGLPLLPEQHRDGVSLAPVLKGESIPERPLFWHYPHYGNQGGEPSSIIRRGDWKLIHYHEDGRNELYHLGFDPGERNDLAAQHPERVARMHAELFAYLETTPAKFPSPWPGYREEMAEIYRQRAIERMESVEIQNSEILDPNWQPNETWWDSALGEQ